MTRSRSMSGISLLQKMAIIEGNLMKEVDENSSLEDSGSRVRMNGTSVPSSLRATPSELLLNSWPLLTMRRALISGVLASVIFFGGILGLILAIWFACGFLGLAVSIGILEGCFCLFSKWRYRKLNEQPPRHEPKVHNGWNSFHKFLKVVKMRAPDGTLLMNIHDYMNVWFRGVDVSEIKRDNVMELLCYGFWYKTRRQLRSEGLGHVPKEMLEMLEEAAETKYECGFNPNLQYMAHLWEPVRCVYRPFSFYLITEFAGFLSHTMMSATGFVKQHHAGYNYYTFAGNPARTKGNITKEYKSNPNQYRGHVRTMSVAGNPLPEAKPIVFLHGVGIGILPYVDFIYSLVCTGHPVVVVECRHVSMRVCVSIPTCDEVAVGVASIMDKIGISDACFVSHSYGTFVLSRIVKSMPERVFSACFIDPVCMGMFLPRLLSTFVYRKARRDSWAHYILDVARMTVCREIGIAATMCRKFAWSELNIWPEDLPKGKTLLVFSGEVGLGLRLVQDHRYHSFFNGNSHRRLPVMALLLQFVNMSCGPGEDILVPSREMMRLVEVFDGDHKVMYQKDLTHGEFLMRPDWKISIVNEIVNMALVDSYQSKQEAEAEKVARKTTLKQSLEAMDDINQKFVRRIAVNVGDNLRRTLSFPWKL